MSEVTEVRLPGVGVRHEYTTSAGDRVGVLTHRSGHREVLLYDRDDPDRCRAVLHLDPEEAYTLAELLGGAQVSEAAASVQRIEGLAIDWLTVRSGSSLVGSTIAEARLGSRTGASIVAVVRGDTTLASPGPEHRLQAGDVAVAVGTAEGLSHLRELLGT